VGKHNITTIKEKRSLLLKTSKEFSIREKSSITVENTLQEEIIIIKERVIPEINL